MDKHVTFWAVREIFGGTQIVLIPTDRQVIGPGKYKGSLWDYYRSLGYQIEKKTEHSYIKREVLA